MPGQPKISLAPEIVCYHVFADNFDFFTRSWKEALDSYRELQERGGARRLWREVYVDEQHLEDGSMHTAECLYSYGEYPL